MARKKRRKIQRGNDINETPIYERQIEESDLLWLVEKYKKQVKLNPDFTLEEFARQHGIETKLLNQYIYEPHSDKGGVTLWHGTTVDRARSITADGFRSKGGETGGKRIWFTRNPKEARRIAQNRSNQRGEEPVVFRCRIDLWDYDEYDRPRTDHYAFKHHTISNEVIHGTEGLKREKISKLKIKIRQQQLVDVGINEASNELVIVYWINSYLKLNGDSAVSVNHPAVTVIQDWVNTQYSQGRETPISDEEMLHLVLIHLPEYFECS
jgi:hypothetical protein